MEFVYGLNLDIDSVNRILEIAVKRSIEMGNKFIENTMF